MFKQTRQYDFSRMHKEVTLKYALGAAIQPKEKKHTPGKIEYANMVYVLFRLVG